MAEGSSRPSGTGSVRIWLVCMAGLILAMVIVGGATRLTDSGLSITEWQPILGAIPPLTEADWQGAFAKYKQIPEYSLINKDMSLSGFKSIYWWEWAHRFLGRFVGLAFLVPLMLFWWRGAIDRPLRRRLIFVFILGGLQGALGWYMVMSGLVDRVDVSQYRLAAHLGLAVVLFAYVFWLFLDLGENASPTARSTSLQGPGIVAAGLLVCLVFVQVLLGGLVAGLDAGIGYNTWPAMGDGLVPLGLWTLEPWYLNLFENSTTVQFNHRMLAYGIALFALVHVTGSLRKAHNVRARMSSWAVLAAILAQAGLGIWTLLEIVPFNLALAHQAGAVLVLAVCLWHLHSLKALSEP